MWHKVFALLVWGIHIAELLTNDFPLHVFNKKENIIFDLPGTFFKKIEKVNS